MPRTLTSIAVVALAASALVACSSSGGGSSSPSSAQAGSGSAATTASGSASSCVTSANQAVAAAEAAPKPNIPTATVDAAKAKGKTIWMIQATITPLVTDVTTAFQKAGSAAGVKTKIVNGNGSVATTTQAISEAISQHADAIVLFAINVSEVKSQVAAAKAAKIPVIDTFNGDDNQDMTAQGVFGHVSEDPTAAGKTVADWMLADTSCKLHTAILGASVVTPHALSAAGAQKEIKAQCSACSSTFVNLDLTKLATDAGAQAQQTLRRNPNINVLMSCFDGAVPLIIAGLKQSSASNVKIISMDGTDSSIDLIRSGKSPQVADVALPPVDYIGWSYMDQSLRALAGAAPANGVLPYRLIDKSNVGPAGTDLFPGFADYQAQYKKLWGVTG